LNFTKGDLRELVKKYAEIENKRLNPSEAIAKDRTYAIEEKEK